MGAVSKTKSQLLVIFLLGLWIIANGQLSVDGRTKISMPTTNCISTSDAQSYGWDPVTRPVVIYSDLWEGSQAINAIIAILLKEVYSYENVSLEVGQYRFNQSVHIDQPYESLNTNLAYIAGDVWSGSQAWYDRYYGGAVGGIDITIKNGLATRPGLFVTKKLTTDFPAKDFSKYSVLQDSSVLAALPPYNFRASGKDSSGNYFCTANKFPWCDSEGRYVPPQCQADITACRQIWHRYPEDSEGQLEQLIKNHQLLLIVIYLGDEQYTYAKGILDAGAQSFAVYTWEVRSSLHALHASSLVRIPFTSVKEGCVEDLTIAPATGKRTCDWFLKSNAILVSSSVEVAMPNALVFLNDFLTDSSTMTSIIADSFASDIITASCNWIKTKGSTWRNWVNTKTTEDKVLINLVPMLPMSGPKGGQGVSIFEGIRSGIQKNFHLIDSKVRLSYEKILDHRLEPVVARQQIVALLSNTSVHGILGPMDGATVLTVQGHTSLYGIPTIDQGVYGTAFEDKAAYPTLYRVAPKVERFMDFVNLLFKEFKWVNAHVLLTNSPLGLDASRGLLINSNSVIRYESNTLLNEKGSKSQQQSEISAFLKKVESGRSRIIILVCDIAQARMVIEQAAQRQLIGTEEYIWIGFDNWANELLIRGWSGFEKYLNGLLIISRYSDLNILDDKTDVKWALVGESERSFSIPINSEVNSALGYDSALSFMIALNKTIANLTSTGIPVNCLSPYVFGRVRVAHMCELSNDQMNNIRERIFCSGAYNYTGCKEIKAMQLLGSEELRILSSTADNDITKNPRMLLLLNLAEVNFRSAGGIGDFSFDSINDRNGADGFLYNFVMAGDSNISVKRIATFSAGEKEFPQMTLIDTGAVLGAGTRKEFKTQLPSDTKVALSNCEKLDSQGVPFSTDRDLALEVNFYGELLAAIAVPSLGLVLIGVCVLSSKRVIFLLKERKEREKQGKEASKWGIANMVLLLFYVAESFQVLGVLFAPRYSFAKDTNIPYIVASSFGLYVAFEWSFYIYSFLVFVFLSLLLFVRNFDYLFTTQFGNLEDKGYLINFCDDLVECGTSVQKIKATISSALLLLFVPVVMYLGNGIENIGPKKDIEMGELSFLVATLFKCILALLASFASYKPLLYVSFLTGIIAVYIIFLSINRASSSGSINMFLLFIFSSWLISGVILIVAESISASDYELIFPTIAVIDTCVIVFGMLFSFRKREKANENEGGAYGPKKISRKLTMKAKALVKAVTRPSAVIKAQKVHALTDTKARMIRNVEKEQTEDMFNEIAYICALNRQCQFLNPELLREMISLLHSQPEFFIQLFAAHDTEASSRHRKAIFSISFILLSSDLEILHRSDENPSYQTTMNKLEMLLLAFMPDDALVPITSNIDQSGDSSEANKKALFQTPIQGVFIGEDGISNGNAEEGVVDIVEPFCDVNSSTESIQASILALQHNDRDEEDKERQANGDGDAEKSNVQVTSRQEQETIEAEVELPWVCTNDDDQS
eukprot:Nk52_evm28s2209 gene=Nk52_evmTU28s2209